MTQQEVSERRTALEKKWGPIMFDRWNQMKWFVTLANTDLKDPAACSDGDFQNWQDACEAIRMVPLSLSPTPTTVGRKRYPSPGGGTGSASPTRDVVRRIHDAITPKLDALADRKGASFSCNSVSHSIQFDSMGDPQQRAGYAPHLISSSANVAGYGHDVWPDEFVLRCAQSLATFHAGRNLVDAIRRCPHCQKIFLQFRRNAIYCGPACYSVAGMRRLREKERAEKALTLKRKTRRKGVRL